ncbi:hypothetical protein C8Q76DRAFT_688614 [Earliella scabrosa]|nr:hypothetical protein C8Q76DRAFT_688614 [Earliella scabrosa]
MYTKVFRNFADGEETLVPQIFLQETDRDEGEPRRASPPPPSGRRCCSPMSPIEEHITVRREVQSIRETQKAGMSLTYQQSASSRWCIEHHYKMTTGDFGAVGVHWTANLERSAGILEQPRMVGGRGLGRARLGFGYQSEAKSEAYAEVFSSSRSRRDIVSYDIYVVLVDRGSRHARAS